MASTISRPAPFQGQHPFQARSAISIWNAPMVMRNLAPPTQRRASTLSPKLSIPFSHPEASHPSKETIPGHLPIPARRRRNG
ncbi:hypothetical protein BDV18DRAFT_2 [Aspergillus unguis]